MLQNRTLADSVPLRYIMSFVYRLGHNIRLEFQD